MALGRRDSRRPTVTFGDGDGNGAGAPRADGPVLLPAPKRFAALHDLIDVVMCHDSFCGDYPVLLIPRDRHATLKGLLQSQFGYSVAHADKVLESLIKLDDDHLNAMPREVRFAGEFSAIIDNRTYLKAIDLTPANLAIIADIRTVAHARPVAQSAWWAAATEFAAPVIKGAVNGASVAIMVAIVLKNIFGVDSLVEAGEHAGLAIALGVMAFLMTTATKHRYLAPKTVEAVTGQPLPVPLDQRWWMRDLVCGPVRIPATLQVTIQDYVTLVADSSQVAFGIWISLQGYPLSTEERAALVTCVFIAWFGAEKITSVRAGQENRFGAGWTERNMGYMPALAMLYRRTGCGRLALDWYALLEAASHAAAANEALFQLAPWLPAPLRWLIAFAGFQAQVPYAKAFDVDEKMAGALAEVPRRYRGGMLASLLNGLGYACDPTRGWAQTPRLVVCDRSGGCRVEKERGASGRLRDSVGARGCVVSKHILNAGLGVVRLPAMAVLGVTKLITHPLYSPIGGAGRMISIALVRAGCSTRDVSCVQGVPKIFCGLIWFGNAAGTQLAQALAMKPDGNGGRALRGIAACGLAIAGCSDVYAKRGAMERDLRFAPGSAVIAGRHGTDVAAVRDQAAMLLAAAAGGEAYRRASEVAGGVNRGGCTTGRAVNAPRLVWFGFDPQVPQRPVSADNPLTASAPPAPAASAPPPGAGRGFLAHVTGRQAAIAKLTSGPSELEMTSPSA